LTKKIWASALGTCDSLGSDNLVLREPLQH